MRLEKVKRWQWALIGAAAGALLASEWRPGVGADGPAARVSMVDSQRRFEGMLVQRDSAGQLRLRDILVYPPERRTGSSGETTIHLVTGRYVSGPERPEGVPVGYEAAVPFVPKADLARYVRTGGPDFAAQYRGLASPTIRDYLAILKEAAGVESAYAWWRLPGVIPAAWIIGMVLALGGLWPTVINLLVYHSLRRPKEEAGMDLSKATPTKVVAATALVPTDADLDALGRLEREMEANLFAANQSDPRRESAAVAAITAPVPKLSDGVSEPVVVAAKGPGAEFGADRDDYYPTVRHAAAHGAPDESSAAERTVAPAGTSARGSAMQKPRAHGVEE